MERAWPLLNRRSLIQGLAVSASSAALPIRLDGASGRATVLVVLVARGASASVASVAEGLSAFSARGIPVALALSSGVWKQLADMPADTRQCAVYWSEEPLPSEPYFQMRSLSTVRRTLAASPNGANCPNTLCAPDPGGDLNLQGLRVTGFRTALMVPTATGPATLATQHSQTAMTRGGLLVRGGEPAEVRRYLEAAVRDPDQAHANLFVDLDVSRETVRRQTTDIAALVADYVERGMVTPLAPQEVGVRQFSHFERLIGVVIDPGSAAREGDATPTNTAALSESLTRGGVPHSVALQNPDALGTSDCLVLPAGPAAIESDVPRGIACVLSRSRDPGQLATLSDFGAQSVVGPQRTGFFGLDGNGLVHLRSPLRARSWEGIEALEQQLSLIDEPVVVLEADAFSTQAQRNAAVASLRRLAELPSTRITDLAVYADALTNPDPVFQTMRNTRVAAPMIAVRPRETPSGTTRDALLDDARRAWRYFETLGAEATGMPSATGFFTPAGDPKLTYDNLTQWDVGSVIFANIAAFDLGILTGEAFAEWRAKALETLYAATLPDRRLPRAVFRVSAPGDGSRDFNAGDAGRLLSALHTLDRRAPAGDTAVRDLVASWDIESSVIDGVPHSLENGDFVPQPDTHVSSYTARAFRRWGIAARSAYSVYNQGETETDHRMHLLHEVAKIGNLGAEPLLLEGIELGWTTQLRYLSDVLFAAQVTHYAETGQLMAPSEAPRDGAPWFTYQGLRVDRVGEAAWDVMVPNGGAEYRTREFRSEARMVASKAAYLWAATRPHAFSDRLLGFVRSHARLPNGFASGVYTADERPTRDYADVNTNGVILQAIAAMLRR